MKSRITDERYISRCIRLASKGIGKVSPNPLVGAVIVKNEKVIGEGFHKRYGEPHAEVNAIKNAVENVAGSTLYCNLEPCCHANKQTPPCVPLIIKKKIKRVVICNIDPNKNVNGKGISILRDAGIEVVTGILEEDGKELNKFYFKYVQQGLPYITLKIAQSLDGKISVSKNQQTWLTGKKSVKMVHRIRAEYDTVLVGAGTIKTDNPLLTVREVKGRNPFRVIVDGNLNISPGSKIFKVKDPIKTLIFYSDSASMRKIRLFEETGTMMIRIHKSKNGKVDLKEILRKLAKNGITSVLVEGGRDIFTQFLEQGLYDEIIVIQTPKILGRGISAFNQKKLKKLKLMAVEKLDADVKLVYRKN